MSDQDLVVETVRAILSGYEPFALTAERPWADRGRAAGGGRRVGR